MGGRGGGLLRGRFEIYRYIYQYTEREIQRQFRESEERVATARTLYGEKVPFEGAE